MNIMKSKLYYLLILPLFSLTFQSCSSNEETYAEWRTENEAYIEGIRNNPNYFEVSIKGGPGSVYCKEIKPSDNKTETYPLYTSQVEVRYKGTLINGTVFDDARTTFSVNGVVQGFAVALQNMQKGDKWEVNIPWQLGYGTTGSGSTILPYSVLIFEVELISICEF